MPKHILDDLTFEEQAMQRAVESGITQLLTTAQNKWNAGDNVTMGALMNLLCYGLAARFDSNDAAVQFIVDKLPHAMKQARKEYDRALFMARNSQGSA